MKTSANHFLKVLGPGILFASTCIGVSHLVQSTRAGALFGFGLLWAIIAANLFKYPFFEYGSRYANVTGKSIIDGYLSMGRWMLWLYFFILLSSMFFVAAAVGAVTAAFMDNLFGISDQLGEQAAIWNITALFFLCVLILLFGKYKVLDSLIKIIGSVLLISTIVAVVMTIIRGPVQSEFTLFTAEAIIPGTAGFAFLIALMGWMPTALDLSAWNSLWTLERIRQTKYKPSLRATLLEFRFGYIASAILAPCFLLLGASLLHGTDIQLPENSAGFAHSIIGLYTSTIGNWSYLIIASAAFSIMFGTCIALFDGYARSSERIIQLLKNEMVSSANSNGIWYKISLIGLGSGALIIIFGFGSSLKSLVDLATSISFILAPIIASANLYLVTNKKFPVESRPGKPLRYLSYSGILFLSIFTLAYLLWE